MHADVLPRFLPARRWQTTEPRKHERPDRIEREVTDDHEGEVARIREAITVEAHRCGEVQRVDRRDGDRHRSRVMARERDRQAIVEYLLRRGTTVRERGPEP